ncbi:protein undicht isoform X2 [Tachypleus tridentatus]
MKDRGTCLELINTNNDNFTAVFQQGDCYHCVRLFVRTLNILEKIETGCVNLENERPTIKTVCRSLDPENELITMFSTNPTPKNCRSSLEGVWKFAYQNRYKFTGECKHSEANITACQMPGTQFFIVNQQFTMNYRKCEGMDETQDAEVQYKCLGDWYIGKNHFFAVVNARESRIDEKYRCFLANRDDDEFLAASITAECNTLKTPQDGPERLRLNRVKAEIVPPKCKLPDNFTGIWINTANFDAEVNINVTHMIETWKPDQGRVQKEVYVCQERRGTRFVMARMGINGCQKDFVCFDFVPRHHNIIRYRRGKAMITSDYATVCSWTIFPHEEDWLYSILITKNPVSIKCPVAGKFKFQQNGDIEFETRIRGGVTQIPRPNVYCRENISDFSVCDPDQRIITIDADYCISVDYFGRPVDIYSEPDYQMKCIGFWKENLKSYLITFDEWDAYSRYRCWVYQRADLNRILMSYSVGPFCHIRQTVRSSTSYEGAQVALSMVEYEREHDNCPMYFDDGNDPYREIAEQVTILRSGTWHPVGSLWNLTLLIILILIRNL